MALFKGFVAYLVDRTGETVLENLGTFVLSIPIATRSKSYGQINSYENLASYLDEPKLCGTVLFGISGVAPEQERYAALLEIAPLTVLRSASVESTGARIKLVNSSGYYAISNSVIPAYPNVARGFDLYDNNGNKMYSNYNYLSSFYMYGDGIIIPAAKTVVDGKITEMFGYVSYATSISGSSYIKFAEISKSSGNQNLIDWLNGLTQYIDNPDPYNPDGESETGGGTGTFDGTGDDVSFPSLPTLSAVDTGFITLFNPSIAQLKTLAEYLWSGAFDVSTWKKIFADPMDAILGMSIVPVSIPNGSLSEVTVGNIGTGISMTKAGSQYVEVDCGTLNVEEYWGAYLDYDPYTKAEIYLPYVGTHPLLVDEIMNKPVHVKYHVDILSGSCCAYVKCGGSVMYSFVGQCSCSIPITGNDWTNVINGALSIAASIGTMVATGGATAPMAAKTIASTVVNSMKPNVEKSGSMGGMGGMLGVQTPYLILTRPRQALPARQNTFMGYPSFITMSLGDCSGYTEIESIHLENIPATEQELSEIENLLKGGVIL